MSKTAVRLLSILLICVMIISCSLTLGCSLEKDKTDPTADPGQAVETAEPYKVKGNPVVFSSKHLDYTLYDFRNAYYSNQYYMYMMYGMISAEDYFNMVIEDASSVVYIYNAAIEAGVELDAEEQKEFDEQVEAQIEAIISQYQNDVDASVTDEAARREEAIKLLNNDLERDGLDYDTFIVLSRNNMLMYRITDKYYEQLRNDLEITDEDVTAYVNEQLGASSEVTTASFKEAYEAYSAGAGAFPVYVPDDCFSVNHILLLFEQSADGNGGVVYDMDSRKDTEAELEKKLASCADFDAFMELETEYGEDPGMDEEGYRENGYLVHGDYDSMYLAGFAYAAMNLYYGSWSPSEDSSYTIPELTYFTLQDGTKIVKVATEPGVHYIIVNKSFTKGPVQYEKEDAHWMSWKDAVADKKLSDQYEELLEGWKADFPITDNSAEIRPEFVPEETAEGSSDNKK